MLLNLTELSSDSIHDQIVHQVTDKILDGELKSGDPMVAVHALARKQRISNSTVRHVYRVLAERGLLEQRQERGFSIARLTDEQKLAVARERMLGQRSPMNAIDNFSKALISTFDPEKIRTLFAENLKNHLFTGSVCFVLQDEHLRAYQLIADMDEGDIKRFAPDDCAIAAVRSASLPQTVNIVFAGVFDSSLVEELQLLGIVEIVPMHSGDNFLGFIGLSAKRGGLPYGPDDVSLLAVLANQFVTALGASRFYIEAIENRRLAEEVRLAREIQDALLPDVLPNDDRFDLAAVSKSCSEVGGDFYDCFRIDENRFGLVIADACGKGLPAAMLISQLQAILKNSSSVSTEHTVNELNLHLKRYAAARSFATLFYGIFDCRDNTIEYVNAGHNAPVLLKPDGTLARLEATGPALGIVADAQFTRRAVEIEPGDIVFFYTDGITETMNEQNDEFGEQRLDQCLVAINRQKPTDLIEMMFNKLDDFRGGKPVNDDRTIMILKYNSR